jgi:hypothetical protein
MSDKRIERTAVGTPSDYAEIEAMSRAELIALILATIESGELDFRLPQSWSSRIAGYLIWPVRQK